MSVHARNIRVGGNYNGQVSSTGPKEATFTGENISVKGNMSVTVSSTSGDAICHVKNLTVEGDFNGSVQSIPHQTAPTKTNNLVAASMARVFHVRYADGRPDRHFIVPSADVLKDLELKNTLPFIPPSVKLDSETTSQMARVIQWLERHELMYAVSTTTYLDSSKTSFSAFNGLLP
jgi:hypothetical protein